MLWIGSMLIVLVTFFIFDQENYVRLISSLIGMTSLIFCAKGHPFGLILMIGFCIMYGIISYSFSYYGEMITYLGMTLPMGIVSLVNWIRNPYEGNKSEVKVAKLAKKDVLQMLALTLVVTVVFYYILGALNTANLIPSTFSVTTSFAAVFLTAKRSRYFTLAYGMNDLVLIILWTLAAMSNISYMSVCICFVLFFINDMYGFINWTKMEKNQA